MTFFSAHTHMGVSTFTARFIQEGRNVIFLITICKLLVKPKYDDFKIVFHYCLRVNNGSEEANEARQMALPQQIFSAILPIIHCNSTGSAHNLLSSLGSLWSACELYYHSKSTLDIMQQSASKIVQHLIRRSGNLKQYACDTGRIVSRSAIRPGAEV